VVGDPEVRITRDPARIMRVIRHAARTGFEIEETTWNVVKANMAKLSLCPTSRIRDEFFKDLKGGACAPWMELAVESGLFANLLPFYGELLEQKTEEDKDALIKRLTSFFLVVDRLNSIEGGVPDHVVIALLLTPWAEDSLELMEVKTLKGAYEVSKKARSLLLETFTKLNIKRGMQDGTTRCLATLPILINHDRDAKGKGWPKWLRKKSYFDEGLQMFKIVREAEGGSKAEGVAIPAAEVAPVKKKEPRKRSSNGNRGPAFAPNVKGGVFGFRRW